MNKHLECTSVVQRKIKIFITIAVKDEEDHLKNLHKIVAFCSDEEKMKRVQEIDDERQILELIG